MPDNFESFIQQHREEFEERGPSPRVWDALEKELGRNSQGKVVRLLAKNWFKAAVIAVLLINGAAIFFFANRSKQHRNTTELAMIAPEMVEAKNFYTNRIEEKLEVIKSYPAAELGLDSSALHELELRNDTYKMLERELKNNPGNERIRAAIVKYYQLKLDLLDKILEELQSKHATSKQSKKQYEAEI